LVNIKDKIDNNADFIILAVKTQDIPFILNDISPNMPILTVQRDKMGTKA